MKTGSQGAEVSNMQPVQERPSPSGFRLLLQEEDSLYQALR